MSGARAILISPRRRRDIVAFVRTHPGQTPAELITEADSAVLRMLLTDDLAEMRSRLLVRVDGQERYWVDRTEDHG